MKTELLTIGAIFVAAAIGAQSTNGVRVDGNADRPLNRFGLSYRAGFNISAKFKNIGGFPAQSNPGAAIAGINHNYDDGYNRVDSSGNTSDKTWYWGYERASQIAMRPGADFLMLSSTSGSGSTREADDDVQHGGELSYQRELGKIGRVYWGVEAAFNYSSVEFEDDSAASLTRITDSYSLGTVVPPQPPYHGSFQGPGPVISDIPIRSITQITLPGNRNFEADIYGFRLGPYVEWPLAERWSFLFSGGLALASINSDFSFSEQVGAVTQRGSGSHSDWNFGGYVNANIIYNITDAVDVFTGVQFQHLGDYDHEVGGRKAEIDLGQSIFAVVGVGFSF